MHTTEANTSFKDFLSIDLFELSLISEDVIFYSY